MIIASFTAAGSFDSPPNISTTAALKRARVTSFAASSPEVRENQPTFDALALVTVNTRLESVAFAVADVKPSSCAFCANSTNVLNSALYPVWMSNAMVADSFFNCLISCRSRKKPFAAQNSICANRAECNT